MSGYDSTLRLKKNDDLGRWRFAADIAGVIRSTPADWSARIGIFGRWGEGKSTVLHFLEEMLKPEGNIIFYFTPGRFKNLMSFGPSLERRFWKTRAGQLELESPWKGVTRKVQETLESTGLSELGEGAADFSARRSSTEAPWVW